MAKELQILEEAIDVARAAYEWYSERSAKAAERFQQAFELAMERIREDASRYPSYLHGTRYYQIRRFPYLVVYRELELVIQVIAVAHGHRREGYWKGRMIQ